MINIKCIIKAPTAVVAIIDAHSVRPKCIE
jgi:hypothetical protein